MADTSIEWADAVWNPTTGCDRVSPGCDNCYALTMARRLKGMGSAKYQTDGDPRTSGPGFGLAMHPAVLEQPLRWRKPRKVFVNSMSDLFHPKVTDEFIVAVFAVMAAAPQHTFQVLTKRPKRMRALLASIEFDLAVTEAWSRLGTTAGSLDGGLHSPPLPLPNVWLGTSVEDQQRADERIPPLLDTPAAVRFLSCEPLLGPVDIGPFVWPGGDVIAGEPAYDGGRLGWVIVGGESGPGHRPMQLDWASRVVSQCQAAGVAVFVKQLGSFHGADHHDIGRFPSHLRVREFPEAVSADA